MIIILCGFSCAGKDTIAKELEKKYGFNFVVSTTTRPIRDGESEKNPYYFIDNPQFEALIKNDELIDYRKYDTLVNNIPDTWYYGVEKKEIEENKDYIVVLDIVGLREFKNNFGDNVISFFIDIDESIRKERCIKRGDYNKEEWNRRNHDDKTRFTKEVVKNEMDFIIKANDSDNNKIIRKILLEYNYNKIKNGEKEPKLFNKINEYCRFINNTEGSLVLSTNEAKYKNVTVAKYIKI